MTNETTVQGGNAPRRSAWVAVALLVVASSILFLWRLGDRGLWSTHEARAARIAEAMLETGDWVELRLNPWTPTFQKPPLYYWTVAALARVSGGEVTPLVTRLPAALATIATVLVVYLFGRQLKGHAAGLIAAGAFMTAMHLLRASRTANLDSMLVLWTTLAFYFFWWAWRREGGWLAYLPMFGAIALGILTKGHIAVVIIGAVVGPFLLWRLALGQRSRAWRASWRCVPGLLLCLAVTAPWFIAMHYRTDGRFTDEYFVRHHLVRTGWVDPDEWGDPDEEVNPDEKVKGFEKKTDWYDYLARIWPSTFPASIFLPGALLWIMFRRDNVMHRRVYDWLTRHMPWFKPRYGIMWLLDRQHWSFEPRLLMPVLWLVLLVAMFSAMSFRKQEYVMPVYPAVALLVAVFLAEYLSIRGQNRFWDILLLAAFVGFCLIGLIVAGSAGLVMHEGFVAWVEGKMTNENGRFTFEVIRGQLVEHLGLTFAMIAAVVVGYVLSLVLWIRRREMAALALVAAATGAMMLFYVAFCVPVIDQTRSHQAFATEALKLIWPGDFVMARVEEDHELCYLLGSDVLVPMCDGRWDERTMRVYDVLDAAVAEGRRAWCIMYRDHYLKHSPGKDFRLVLETLGHHRKPLVLLSYKAGAETGQRN